MECEPRICHARAVIGQHRGRSWIAWAHLYLRTFRVLAVAICLTAAAYALAAHVDWLLAASVCIGLGELLECSYYLAVLDWGARQRPDTFGRQSSNRL